jgi:ketosteroid isomerase-like protein
VSGFSRTKSAGDNIRRMADREHLIDLSEQLAAAIARRDVAAVRGFLADKFVQRPAGGAAVDAEAFLANITSIPGDILFVRVEQLTVDISGDSAIVTGIQQARLEIDGSVVNDSRAFVDWFVRQGGQWRLRTAIDLPSG